MICREGVACFHDQYCRHCLGQRLFSWIPVSMGHARVSLSNVWGVQALGIPIDLSPRSVERCIREAGVGFMYAPR